MATVAKELRLRSLLALADQVVADLCDEVAANEVASVAREALEGSQASLPKAIEDPVPQQDLDLADIDTNLSDQVISVFQLENPASKAEDTRPDEQGRG